MSHLEDKVKIQIVEWYYSKDRSVIKVQRAYKKEYGVKKAPTRKTINKIVNKFKSEGSVKESRHIGGPRYVRTPQNVEKLREKLAQSPRTSISKLSQQLNISPTTVQRMLKEDLKMYPYKVQMLQKQTSRNRSQRVQFVEEISEKIEDDENFISNVHFSDEAHFHLSGEVNKQNCRFWGTVQPFATVEEGSTTREKVTAWCALG